MKALQGIEEIKLVFYNTASRKKPKILHAEDAYKVLVADWEHIDREQRFRILLLDEKYHIVSFFDFSRRGISKAIRRPDLLFANEPSRTACSMILAHNHPSGNLEHGVIALTRMLLKMAGSRGLVVIDHLIITPGSFCSVLGEAYKGKVTVNTGQGDHIAIPGNGNANRNRKTGRDKKKTGKDTDGT